MDTKYLNNEARGQRIIKDARDDVLIVQIVILKRKCDGWKMIIL